MLTFDAEGRLLSVERDVAPQKTDARAGVEFFSGLLVPAEPRGEFTTGTSPGVTVIDRVDWETLVPRPGACFRRIL